MVNIDYILELLDWNRSPEDQRQGMKLAKNVRCINVFLQPGKPYGKRVWENCAEILAQKNDEELSLYLINLMEWIQDMNWPGAFRILDRLKNYKNDSTFKRAFQICRKCAQILEDETWESNLELIKK